MSVKFDYQWFDDGVLVTRPSIFGSRSTMLIRPGVPARVFESQVRDWQSGWFHLSEVLGYLTPSEQSFMYTGLTPEQWTEYMDD